MLLTLLMSSRSYSQSILVSSETLDTTICFNIAQSRFLLKQHYKVEECNQLLGIAEQTIGVLNKIVFDKNEVIKTQEQLVNTLEKGIRVRDGEITRLKLETENCYVEVKRQKSQKVWFFLGGSLIGGIMGLYYR